MTTRSDADLVIAVAAGDSQSLAAIFDRYGPRVYAFCRSMLHHQADADDCLQDVFVIAATRLAGLREPDRLRSWLFSVARNACLRRLDRSRREVPVNEIDDRPYPNENQPMSSVLDHELARLMEDSINGLVDRDRLVIELADRQGLSTEELGSALAMSSASAHKLLVRARTTARRCIGALLVARTGRQRCGDLNALLGNWNGRLTPVLRKRIARHIEDCSVCTEQERRVASPAALLRSAPAIILPLPWLTPSPSAPIGSVAAHSLIPDALRDRVLQASIRAHQAMPSGPLQLSADPPWSDGWPPADPALRRAARPHSWPTIVGAAAAAAAAISVIFLLFQFVGPSQVSGQASAGFVSPGSLVASSAPTSTEISSIGTTPSTRSADSSAPSTRLLTPVPPSGSVVEPTEPTSPSVTRLSTTPPVISTANTQATQATQNPTIEPMIVTMSVNCRYADGSFTPWLTWTTVNTDRIALSVDNPDVVGSYGEYPSDGSVALPPNGCDPQYGQQIYTIYAYGAGNSRVDRTIYWDPPTDLAPPTLASDPMTPESPTPTTEATNPVLETNGLPPVVTIIAPSELSTIAQPPLTSPTESTGVIIG